MLQKEGEAVRKDTDDGTALIKFRVPWFVWLPSTTLTVCEEMAQETSDSDPDEESSEEEEEENVAADATDDDDKQYKNKLEQEARSKAEAKLKDRMQKEGKW